MMRSKNPPPAGLGRRLPKLAGTALPTSDETSPNASRQGSATRQVDNDSENVLLKEESSGGMNPTEFVQALGNPAETQKLVDRADKGSLKHYFSQRSLMTWLSEAGVDRSRFISELLFNAQTSLRIETGADALVADVISHLLTCSGRAYEIFGGRNENQPAWGVGLEGRLYRFADKVSYYSWSYERLDSKATGPGWSRLRVDRIDMEESAHLLPYRRTPQVWGIQKIRDFYEKLNDDVPQRFSRIPRWLGTDVSSETPTDRVVTILFHQALTPFAALSITLPDVNALAASNESLRGGIPGWLWFEFYFLQSTLAPVVWRLLRIDEALASYQREQRDEKAIITGDWGTTLFCRSLAAKRCLTEAFFAGLFGSHVVLEGQHGDGRHVLASYIAAIRQQFVLKEMVSRFAIVDAHLEILNETRDLSRRITISQFLDLLNELKPTELDHSVVTWQFYLPDVFEWDTNARKRLAELMDKVQRLRGVRCIYFFGVEPEPPDARPQAETSNLPWEELLHRTIRAAPVVHVPNIGAREKDIGGILGQWLWEPFRSEQRSRWMKETVSTKFNFDKDVVDELAKGMPHFSTFAEAADGFESLCRMAEELDADRSVPGSRIQFDLQLLGRVGELAAEGEAGKAAPFFGREATLASPKAKVVWERLRKDNGASFDEVMKEPYHNKDLGDEEMRWIICEALKTAAGNYRQAAGLLNVYTENATKIDRDKAYKRFMAFLQTNALRVDYKQFRSSGRG